MVWDQLYTVRSVQGYTTCFQASRTDSPQRVHWRIQQLFLWQVHEPVCVYRLPFPQCDHMSTHNHIRERSQFRIPPLSYQEGESRVG
jgi:hypothetical protein